MGIHLGHDASVTIVRDGQVLSHVLQERISRIRHDYGLDLSTVEIALNEANLEISQISRVAITGTQLTPAIIRNIKSDDMFINFDARQKSLIHQHYFKDLSNLTDIEKTEYTSWLKDVLKDRGVEEAVYANSLILDVNDPFKKFYKIETNKDLNWVNGQIQDFNSSSSVSINDLRFDVEIKIFGKKIRGSWWSHHASHARSNQNLIGKERDRIIISIDGGSGYLSGAIWFKSVMGQLELITPHFIEIGRFYEFVSERLGLGKFGYSAGKLMGLAGHSVEKQDELIPSGTAQDWSDFASLSQYDGNLYNHLFTVLAQNAFSKQAINDSIAENTNVLSPEFLKIAKSTQELVERTLTLLVEQIISKFGKNIEIGITGGVALNCPTNTLINKLIPNKVYIEPHCEDGGLSIGSALLEEDFSHKNNKPQGTMISSYAYMGISRNEDELNSIFRSKLVKVETTNPHNYIAEKIGKKNAVVAIFAEKSETGPRALGSRSILADPRIRENWERVNEIKKGNTGDRLPQQF
jgi:carbamoyltransferase